VEPIIWEWVNFMLRWLHVVAAMAWIGSSFYFIHLDASLKRQDGLPKGAAGEAWQIHGGGFYRMVKYLVAPEKLPRELTWFKWESYTTWLSGFFLLVVLYYRGADLFLIDPSVQALTPGQAVSVSLAGLAAGWLGYDLLCRSPLGRHNGALAAAGFVLLIAGAWGLSHLFSGRGAMLQTGALMGTIMTANVFLIIMPNQRKAIASMLAGQTPDPALGKQAKQRSLHNNYLTLPVVFLMLSNHYPTAFGTRDAWATVALVLIAGASIRHFFNRQHAGLPRPWWTWAVAAGCICAAVGLSLRGPSTDLATTAPATEAAADEIVAGRCSMCHAASPVWDGIPTAPRGVRLDTPEEIRRHAAQIRLAAVLSHAMPPGNVTEITEEERALLGRWTAEEAAGG
jgi:uncharacterized membrane protein